jgi:hypothetical protein
MAAWDSMHVAQRSIMVAQQDANQAAMDAHQQEAVCNKAI